MTRSLICFALLTVATAAAAASADTAAGEKVFAAQKCQLCHSIAGKGNPKGPLDEVGSKLSDGDLRLWITDAKGMTEKSKATRSAPICLL